VRRILRLRISISARRFELTGQRPDAEKHYRSAIALRPDFVDAHPATPCFAARLTESTKRSTQQNVLEAAKPDVDGVDKVGDAARSRCDNASRHPAFGPSVRNAEPRLEMRKRRIRRTVQDLFELHARLVEAPERPQSAPEIVARLDISGVQPHRALEAGCCIGKRSIGGENHPAVV